jgi:tripartite-type tricarboxylate transporter receptor subunit TctC
VRIITPFNPGISPDAAARIFADALAKSWKQPVIVENRPGADTMIGTEAFLRAQDSHTLLFTTHSSFTVMPLLHVNVPYDPVRDAHPVSLAVEDYIGVVTAPSLEVDSLKEFVDLAKARPTQLNFYAAPGSPYLAYVAFARATGIQTMFVPYNSPVNAVSDLSEGRIHIAVVPLASVLGAIQGGKLKLIAITNSERAAVAPDVRTASEQGYPDLAFGGFLGFFAANAMTAELRERISSNIRTVLQDPEVRDRLAKLGLLPRGSTPGEFETLIEEQRARWQAIARTNNIEPQ